jgi:hypothetical protein
MRELGSAVKVLVALAATSCGAGAARFPTSEARETEAPRRPPGVAVDPELELPPASPRGTTESFVSVLSAPRDLKHATGLVAAFFRAITLESGEALDLVISSDASLDSSSGRFPARAAWRSRFAQFDYQSLRSASLYRDGDLETYRGSDQPKLGVQRRLPEMRADDVFVRVRLDVTQVQKTRLFADEIGFLMRPSGDGYQIVTISEDFAVP